MFGKVKYGDNNLFRISYISLTYIRFHYIRCQESMNNVLAYYIIFNMSYHQSDIC